MTLYESVDEFISLTQIQKFICLHVIYYISNISNNYIVQWVLRTNCCDLTLIEWSIDLHFCYWYMSRSTVNQKCQWFYFNDADSACEFSRHRETIIRDITYSITYILTYLLFSTDRTLPIIVNATADKMKEHFLPVVRKLRELDVHLQWICCETSCSTNPQRVHNRPMSYRQNETRRIGRSPGACQKSALFLKADE